MSEKAPQPEIRSVDSYYSSSASPNADPHRYPGERPDHSFYTDGVDVMPIEVADDFSMTVVTRNGVQPINDMLTEAGVPTMEERIPIVAYGANLCPQTLRNKMKQEGRPDLAIVPTVYGWLHGADVVWGERPGVRGAFFAELYADESVADTSVLVGINFLTPEQILFMHKSEGSYNFGNFSEVTLENGRNVPAQMYVGAGNALQKDGQPVAVEGIERQNGHLPSQNSFDTLEYLLENDIVRSAIASNMGVAPEEVTARGYTDFMLSLEPPERLIKARTLIPVVREAGLSASTGMSDVATKIHSWSNPSTAPRWANILSGTPASTLINLPEQELPREGLSEEALDARSKVLTAVQKHWHRSVGRLK